MMLSALRSLVLASLLSAHPAWALDLDETRHLLDRVAFGARPDTVDTFAPLSREQAVDRILQTAAALPTVPDWADARPFPDRQRLKTLPDAEREAEQREYNQRRRAQALDLKAWWYHWMLATPTPLTERMTLVWHGHFTSALRTVRSSPLMLRQNTLLRRFALGNYADLLRAVVTDPAMLVYLDGRRNRKGKPNENFARELLELFTLGEGHYSEADVQAAARALSGWKLDPASGTARFDPRQHDDGVKTLLGKTGHWGVEGVVAILLEQPRTAERVTERLWREFVSPQPDPAEVKRLAALFREAGYELRPLLRALLLSDAFWADENRGTLIKSPVELIVGTLYRFGLERPPDPQLIKLGRQFGQDLFDPPDVKGWPGGHAWIEADRLLARERFLRQVTRDLADESTETGRAWGSLDAATLRRLLWPVTGPEVAPTADEVGVRDRLVATILDPRFQLK